MTKLKLGLYRFLVGAYLHSFSNFEELIRYSKLKETED